MVPSRETLQISAALQKQLKNNMDFKEYQERAKETAYYANVGKNYIYPALGLTGEAGEIANKIRKIEPGPNGEISQGAQIVLQAEIGDLLWYTAQLCSELGLSLDAVAKENIAKLARRKADGGTMRGNGELR